MAILEESKTKKIYDTKDLSINAEYRRQFQIYKNENKDLFCKLCDKQLKTKHGFKDHYTKRHDTKTIQCNDCNKILRFGQWFSHQKTHQKIICPHCEKNIPLLMKSKHVPTCTENPQRIAPIKYPCDQCDFVTLGKYRIEIHRQRHKKFSCENCKKKFKTLENLENHNLKAHRTPRIKQKPNILKCEFCDYQSIHKGTFNRHQGKCSDRNNFVLIMF